MTTVALIGPDGAGKTTIAERLLTELGRPAAYLYMGSNPNAGSHQLATTRLVWAIRRRRGVQPDTGPPGALPTPAAGTSTRRLGREIRSIVRSCNLMAEEGYRSAVVRRAERRGAVVLFDRHYYFDYHAHDILGGAGRNAGRRLHGWFLRRVLRKPDLVLYLEAPAEELLRRKQEGTVEDLRRRQGDYERSFAGLQVVRIDATQPLDAVIADARAAIVAFLA